MNAKKAFGLTSALLLLTVSAYGQAFSVVNGGPQGLPGDTIYTPGPTPLLFGTGLYEVDAISGNTHVLPDGWAFSVDINSLGAPATAVNIEAVGGDQPADIYTSAGFGLNALAWDGNGSSAPGLGLIEPGPVPVGDDVDGLELHGFPGNALTPHPPGAIYYSLSQASAVGIGFDGATLFMSPALNGYDVAPFVPYATSGMLGLLGGGADDIDAAVVYDNDLDGIWSAGDYVDFSLTAGSLSGGSADILRSTFGGGPPVVIAAAGSLGLLPTDNIDALDVIPEPSSVILIALGGLLLLKGRRVFRS